MLQCLHSFGIMLMSEKSLLEKPYYVTIEGRSNIYAILAHRTTDSENVYEVRQTEWAK